MTVVFPQSGHVGEVLRSTGTVEHSRMVFQISEGV